MVAFAWCRVENTFTSIDDMVIELGTESFNLSWIVQLRVFFAFFLTSHWASIRRVPELRIPVLYLSGLQDELIPPSQMSELYQATAMSSLRRMWTLPEGTHNDTYHKGGAAYFTAMASFMDDALRVRADQGGH